MVDDHAVAVLEAPAPGACLDDLAAGLPDGTVATRVGDSDPVQAIEDALREHPADEVIVVTRPDDEATWLEAGASDHARERFAVPVRHLVVAD